jgi:pyrroline-5-carboxylate reductase
MSHANIAFVGAGNMGASLIAGLIADGYPVEKIYASNPSSEVLENLHQRFHIQTNQDNQQVVQQAEVVVLCVKPQVMRSVAIELAGVLKNKLILSVAAGVGIAALEQWLGEPHALVRCMPNTPALVQAGATALFANPQVSEAQKSLAESIMRAVGITVWLENEALIDVATALSGSGPAYFFLVMEAMQQAAVELGLPQEAARLLTLQTGFGATKMALEDSEPLPQLRQRVTSPGGTTQKAVEQLETEGIRRLFQHALHAALQRARELG